MKKIPLSRGLFAIVDDEDFDRLSAIKWHARPIQKSVSGFYAVNGRGGAKPTRHGCRYMHREVLNAPLGLHVDHINGDGLDNRRCNLRLATASENCVNRVAHNPTGFRGVRKSGKNRWSALIQWQGRQRNLGSFSCSEEAAAAYDRAAVSLHGAFAILNFPTCDNAASNGAAA